MKIQSTASFNLLEVGQEQSGGHQRDVWFILRAPRLTGACNETFNWKSSECSAQTKIMSAHPLGIMNFQSRFNGGSFPLN